LVAVGGGAVLAAAAGALRTSSAYPRFLPVSKASDVLVSQATSGHGGYYRALAHLPGAAVVATGIGLNIQPAGRVHAGAVAEVAGDQRIWRQTDIPKVIAGRLAALGMAVLGQLMVISGWRRRRDFATLKALGLLRRQVRAIVAWQVTILTGLALLAGLPLGVAVGRWAWALFTGGLGVPSGTLVPVPFVLLMVPAAVLLANAVAYWPARTAARLRPGQVLRAE
jgi:predicted lysophospholipase L1 biosynthesis ABC-type transport system permease subunit